MNAFLRWIIRYQVWRAESRRYRHARNLHRMRVVRMPAPDKACQRGTTEAAGRVS